MQSSAGQYGIPDMQQFVVGRGAPHMFAAHSQDVTPSPQHRAQVHQLQQHLHPPHQQQQQQQQHQQPVHHHHQQQHHVAQHQQHKQHTQQPQAQQQPQPQPMNLQQQQQQQHHHHHHQQQQKSQPSLQQPLVQQLGLGPESSEMPSPLSARPPPGQFKPVISPRDPLGDDEEGPEEGERGAGCNRWPREETTALLRIRSEMDATFRDSGLKGPLWEEVSRKLAELGYHRSAKKCKEKFENVHKYYKKTKDGRAGRQDGKSYRFYSELEALYAASNNNDSGGSGDGAAVAEASMGQGHGGGALLSTGGRVLGAATEGAAPLQRPETSSGLNLSSTSSGDDYDEPHETEEQECRKKRKRKSWDSMKLFFENLAKQVMKQQEALHKTFLETIERRDQERLIREESYKRQEMARLNRDHELRAQEHALAATRDAALVAFLQKVTGQTLQLPQMPVPPTLATPSDMQDDLEKEGSDINTRRWPKVEVHALIRLRSGLEPRFQEAGPKAQLWEEISSSMACMGFNRSAKRCKEKWENINKYFRKTKDSCRKRPDNAKTCPYFHQLETLYQKGILTSPNSKFNKLEGHSENLLENNKEDSEQAQDGNPEMLAILPAAGDNCPGGSTSSTAVAQLCASQENGTATGDPASKKVKPSHALPDSNVSNQPAPAPSALSFDRIPGLSGSNKALPVEGFVREILELQQQQHQKLVDEYERMEQAREIREQERRQQHEIRLSQERSHSNTRDNAALMALVHKLAGDSSEFTMSAPSSTE